MIIQAHHCHLYFNSIIVNKILDYWFLSWRINGFNISVSFIYQKKCMYCEENHTKTYFSGVHNYGKRVLRISNHAFRTCWKYHIVMLFINDFTKWIKTTSLKIISFFLDSYNGWHMKYGWMLFCGVHCFVYNVQLQVQYELWKWMLFERGRSNSPIYDMHRLSLWEFLTNVLWKITNTISRCVISDEGK